MENNCIATRIKHFLTIYPGINVSMLQLSLTIPADLWKPVLKELCEVKQVVQETIVAESPGKRVQNYVKLYWVEN